MITILPYRERRAVFTPIEQSEIEVKTECSEQRRTYQIMLVAASETVFSGIRELTFFI